LFFEAGNQESTIA